MNEHRKSGCGPKWQNLFSPQSFQGVMDYFWGGEANFRGWRLFVGALFVICLALFLHFREVRIEVLELNATAKRYVVAQVDFSFPDYESTIVLKQQAMQDVGEIYFVDDKEIRDERYHLEEDLIHNKQWKEVAPASTFEEMYKAADALETLLLEARFTDPRTVQKVKELGISDVSYFEFIPEVLHTPIALPDEFWQRLSHQMALNDVFHKETISYIVRFFKKRLWILSQDIALERSLRSSVARTVPEKWTHVQAGHRIIDHGEIITSRHLTMMQAMKQAIAESRKIWSPYSIFASFLLALIFVTISALYFRISQPEFIRSLREISLFTCIVLLTLLFAKLLEHVLLSSSDSISAFRFPIIAPFATILICILLSQRTALFAATVLSILLSVSLAVDHSHFLILNLVTSIVVIICSKGLRRRKEVFTVCLKSWLSAIPVLYAYTLAENHLMSYSFLVNTAAALAFLVVIAILVVGILPALEMVFGVLTDMTLMEYMDPTNPLLRRFAMEVPGTYQHSLVLGNLTETCAQAIGANGLFCRVATLYHDIGKINHPEFFTENQQGSINVHQLLTPLESAQVIIAHVKDGEEIARKAKLPHLFIDVIREHHGTTLVYYFYRKQLELGKEADEKLFRYPGPKPRSRESAIIMICDSIEAASRSLENVNEKSVTDLVNDLVKEKAEDGQFDDCPITFEELIVIKRTLVKTLLLSLHIRVKYPKKEKM